jgi:hypothetical protein
MVRHRCPHTRAMPRIDLIEALITLDGSCRETRFFREAGLSPMRCYKAAAQHLIDGEWLRELPGHYGRLCEGMIEQGLCKPFPRER